MAKAKKWAGLKGKYPETPLGRMTNAASASFMDKVNKHKLELAATPEPDLMARFLEIAKEQEEIAERDTELNAEREAIDRILKDAFESRGIDSARNSVLGKTFYLNVEPYVTINNGQAAEQYVTDRGEELDYLWSVSAPKLGTLVKDLLEEGRDEEVPACVTVFMKTSVRAVKS